MSEYKHGEYQEEDLERYGVWVKAGPEEVIEADDDFAFTDLPSAGGAAADVDDDFDLDLPDIEDLDVDELSLDDDTDDFAIPRTSVDDDSDEDDDLVSLDDLDIEEPDGETDPFAALDEEYGSADAFDSTIPGTDDELEDFSFDDVSISDEGEELPELDVDEEHDFTPEEQGIDIVPESPTNRITPDEEEFLDEENLQNPDESAIPDTMDTQEREAFQQIQQELSDIKRELAELKIALRGARQAPVPADDAAESEPDMEGVKVEDAPAVDEEVHEEGEEAAEASHPSGFFDEDEDETIALTGDELDNILNTAEFTEQAGEAEELDDDFILEQPDDEGAPSPEEEEEDDSAVQELADMDIDRELSDIDSLVDDTEDSDGTATDDIDELEIDLDSLEELDDDGFDSFADQVESDIGPEEEEPDTEPASVAGVEEIELDDDFDDVLDEYSDEDTDEGEDESEEEEEEIELDLDDLDDLDLEDDELERPRGLDLDDGSADELTIDEESPDELTLDEEPEEGLDLDEEESHSASSISDLPDDLKEEIRSVLSYMDQLLEALPDEKIEEFAKSEHFEVYKRLFEELGLET